MEYPNTPFRLWCLSAQYHLILTRSDNVVVVVSGGVVVTTTSNFTCLNCDMEQPFLNFDPNLSLKKALRETLTQRMQAFRNRTKVSQL